MRVRATLHLRNEVMLSARERLGLSQKEAASKAGVPYTFVQAVERMRSSPGRKARKTWSDAKFLAHLRALAAALGVPDDAMAFEEALAVNVEPVSIVTDVAPKALAAFAERTAKRFALPADASLTAEEITGALSAAMERLPWRQREVLKMRADGHSLDEVARVFRITRERVRQMEHRGIGRLRADRQLADRLDRERPTPLSRVESGGGGGA